MASLRGHPGSKVEVAAPIAIGESLSFDTVAGILAHGDAVVAAGELELGGVRRVDSAGIALLLELTRRAQKAGGRLRIRGARVQVRDLLRFFAVERLLDMEDDTGAP